MKTLRKVLPYVVLSIIALPFLLMYVFFFMQAFSEKVILAVIPKKFDISNFSFLWKPIPWGLEKTTVWVAFFNTLSYALTIATISTIVCLLAGYALSRIRSRKAGFFLFLQLALHAVPAINLLIALFFILFYLRLLYTIFGVALIAVAVGVPIGTWIIKGFFDGISVDIERAARIDGCTQFQIWWKIILPLVKPGIYAIFIWAFLGGWSDFIFVYTFLPGTTPVLATLIQSLLATEVVDYGFLAALSLFYLLPPLFLFVSLQKALSKAPIMGGIKR